MRIPTVTLNLTDLDPNPKSDPKPNSTQNIQIILAIFIDILPSGMIKLLVHWTCERPVMHAQT